MFFTSRFTSFLAAVVCCALPVAVAKAQKTAALTPAEARTIAKEAWLYAYAPIQGYQTMYNQTQNKDFPGYVGGFNRFRHYARSATPADKDIVTPNNDTPYSWAWLDLRAEPIVLSLPAVPAPRYYVNQWFDLYTHNFAYTGVRTTGREAGTYMFAGPRWKGVVPKGITKVFRSETDFVGTLTRTQLAGPEDIPAMQDIQVRYKLMPLSQFTRKPAPKPAPPVAWPAWDANKAEGIGFIAYLNALLPFMPTVPSEQAAFARFAKIGIGPGKAFDPAKFDPATRSAIDQGIADASKQLNEFALARTDSKAYFGMREFLGADYVMNRAAGAKLGIYANSKEEAVYVAYQTAPDGKLLDGSKKWILRFEPGQQPPVTLFWSITMYNLPGRLLVENPINRYSIGDRTAGLKQGPDGSLEIYLQNENPGPEKVSNWLPTPNGPFFLASRYYGPKQPLIDGTWKGPPLVERP
jgi:hypothetical protein